jgi:hypothetical protein
MGQARHGHEMVGKTDTTHGLVEADGDVCQTVESMQTFVRQWNRHAALTYHGGQLSWTGLVRRERQWSPVGMEQE